MSYQSDIFDAIQASSAITALIGNRLFWDIADGDAIAPYAVAQTVSVSGETDLRGRRNVEFPLIQFSFWAKTKAEVIAISSAFKTAMEGRNLPGTSDTSLGFSGQHSTYESESRLFGEIMEYRASITIA